MDKDEGSRERSSAAALAEKAATEEQGTRQMPTEGDGRAREAAERAAEQLGREYRQVGRELAEVEDEIGGVELLALAKMVETKLWPRVERPQEAVLDAKLMRSLAMIADNEAREIKVGAVDFKPGDFAARLKARRLEAGLGGGAASWVKMGKQLQHLFACSPALTFLQGALAHGPAEVVAVARKRPMKADSVCDLQATKEVRVHKLKGESDETSVKVEQMFRALVEECKKAEGAVVPYFEFVFHPNDFGISIERAFHLSFLIYDGRAGIHIDEKSGQPAIFLPDQEGAEQTRNAVIINFTMEDWRRMKPNPGIPSPEWVDDAAEEHGNTVENALDEGDMEAVAIETPGYRVPLMDDDTDSDASEVSNPGSELYRRMHSTEEAAEVKESGRTREMESVVSRGGGWRPRVFPLTDQEVAEIEADRDPAYPPVL